MVRLRITGMPFPEFDEVEFVADLVHWRDAGNAWCGWDPYPRAGPRKEATAEGHGPGRPPPLAEGDGPEICYAVRSFLIYSSRRYGVQFRDVFTRRVRPAAVRASRAIQVAC